MKRDIDLIRFILLNVESDGEIAVPAGHTAEEIADHVQQLIEGGFSRRTCSEKSPRNSVWRCYHSITSKGHDFVDATRNHSFWMKTKAYVTKSLPGWTLTVIKEVAERALKGEIKL
jgi:hypothetical protein